MPNYKPFPLTAPPQHKAFGFDKVGPVLHSQHAPSSLKEATPGRSLLPASHHADNRAGVAPHLARSLEKQYAPKPYQRKPDTPGVKGDGMCGRERRAGYIKFLWKQPGWTTDKIAEKLGCGRQTVYNVVTRRTWAKALPMAPAWWGAPASSPD